MRTGRKLALLAALGLAGAFVACTLNPQPLPPSDEASSFGDDSGSRSDGGVFGTDPRTPSDAAPVPNDNNEGGAGSGDAGDAGDGGGEAGDAGDGGDAG